ncbi:MAG: hypothetical protein AAGC64_13390 [Bacteroidota bacterium]
MSDSKLEKISAYVPKEVKRKLEETANKENISISQAIIGALVKAYNLEDIEIGRASKRIVVGADIETKKRIESLEHKVDQILDQMLSQQQVATQTTSEEPLEYDKVANNGAFQNKSIDKSLDNSFKKENAKQLTLDSPISLKPLTGVLLGSRLKVSDSTIGRNRRNYSEQKFKDWSANKDPDNIAWIYDLEKTRYIPSEESTEEQLFKLKEWLAENP